MALNLSLLLFALMVILLSSELFTNGVEWLGKRLSLSEGVVGSVLAAVGTALPETLIPLVGILFFSSDKGHDVGIGAIAGAPFMLTTLTFALCGTSMWFYAAKGRRKPALTLNKVILCRDLRFFILGYSLAMLATAARDLPAVRCLIGLVLILTYGVYLHRTFSHKGEVGEPPEQLHFHRFFGAGPERLRLIVVQVVCGLGGILGGAFVFVDSVSALARLTNVPPVLLSFIIAPIATELPEKVNSVLWARSGKDTLAMGNITGALVFQSCFPVALGVACTRWSLAPATIGTGIVALVSAAIYLRLIESGNLRPAHLMLGSLAYLLTVALLIATGIQAND